MPLTQRSRQPPHMLIKATQDLPYTRPSTTFVYQDPLDRGYVQAGPSSAYNQKIPITPTSYQTPLHPDLPSNVRQEFDTAPPSSVPPIIYRQRDLERPTVTIPESTHRRSRKQNPYVSSSSSPSLTSSEERTAPKPPPQVNIFLKPSSTEIDGNTRKESANSRVSQFDMDREARKEVDRIRREAEESERKRCNDEWVEREARRLILERHKSEIEKDIRTTLEIENREAILAREAEAKRSQEVSKLAEERMLRGIEETIALAQQRILHDMVIKEQRQRERSEDRRWIKDQLQDELEARRRQLSGDEMAGSNVDARDPFKYLSDDADSAVQQEFPEDASNKSEDLTDDVTRLYSAPSPPPAARDSYQSEKASPKYVRSTSGRSERTRSEHSRSSAMTEASQAKKRRRHIRIKDELIETISNIVVDRLLEELSPSPKKDLRPSRASSTRYSVIGQQGSVWPESHDGHRLYSMPKASVSHPTHLNELHRDEFEDRLRSRFSPSRGAFGTHAFSSAQQGKDLRESTTGPGGNEDNHPPRSELCIEPATSTSDEAQSKASERDISAQLGSETLIQDGDVSQEKLDQLVATSVQSNGKGIDEKQLKSADSTRNHTDTDGSTTSITSGAAQERSTSVLKQLQQVPGYIGNIVNFIY